MAEALQVSISIAPILIYQVLRRPYIPCQDLPESAFVTDEKKKPKTKKTWRQKLFSLETLCIISLASTVFMAGFLDHDDGPHGKRNNEFRYNSKKYKSYARNRNTNNGAYR